MKRPVLQKPLFLPKTEKAFSSEELSKSSSSCAGEEGAKGKSGQVKMQHKAIILILHGAYDSIPEKQYTLLRPAPKVSDLYN